MMGDDQAKNLKIDLDNIVYEVLKTPPMILGVPRPKELNSRMYEYFMKMIYGANMYFYYMYRSNVNFSQ